MKKVYYLGYYDTDENKEEKRNVTLAATNKMTYIVEALEKSGFEIEIVSPSTTSNATTYCGKVIPICNHSRVRLFRTTPWGNKFRRIVSVLSMRFQYQRYIIKNLTKNDTLIVYHSMEFINFIIKAKKKIGFKLVLEMEEIYSDISGIQKNKEREIELSSFADAFIFPSELLNEKINVSKKPYIITHGTYKIEPPITEKFNDGKIHIVYAGTFDPKKGGVFIAIESAKWLDENYHLHVLGAGTKKNEELVFNLINSVNRQTDCTVTFDGLLTGKNFCEFLQKCDIGLSTQNPNFIFNDTSFPSKVLTYLSNGLRVVSVRIPVLESSGVSDLLYYYEGEEPETLSNTIKSICLSDLYDSRETVESLNVKFINDVHRILCCRCNDESDKR